MKTMKGLVLLAAVGLGVLPALPLRAEGLYVLGALGAKSVYDEDFNDYYNGGAPGDGYAVPYYDAGGLGEADLNLGWRFPGVMAVEAGAGVDSGRAASSETVLGDSTLTVNPMYTVSLGPVVCWERPRLWFAERGLAEFGLRVEYSTLSGSEVVDGYGSQDFNAGAPGFGVFARFLNVWDSDGLNVGVEFGYDDTYFNTLILNSTKGGFAGDNGQALTNYSGGNAYLDNSGGYLRFIIGWSQAPSPGETVPSPRRWRRGYYQDDSDRGYPDDGNYGN